MYNHYTPDVRAAICGAPRWSSASWERHSSHTSRMVALGYMAYSSLITFTSFCSCGRTYSMTLHLQKIMRQKLDVGYRRTNGAIFILLVALKKILLKGH